MKYYVGRIPQQYTADKIYITLIPKIIETSNVPN